MFRFEKLDVWKKSVSFASQVYLLTRKFPSEERFGLTSQMRRAATAISSNLAEATGRNSDREFSRFIQIAYASLMETVSQTHIAVDQKFLSTNDFEHVYQLAEELARMLSGLRRSVDKRV